MRENLKQWWLNLPSEQRTKALTGVTVLSVIMMGLLAYNVTGQGEAIAPQPEMTAIQLGDELLEDDLRKQIEGDRERQEETNKVFSEQINEVSATIHSLNELMTSLKNEEPETSAHALASENPIAYPPMPQYTPNSPALPAEFPEEQPLVLERVVGGIAVTEGTPQPPEPAKKKSGIYMSPGFMEGMLLTGLKAETIEGASENPEPMMIRVQAPAVLPNAVKANLKGCFVIAHGFGKLNKERIEARLVSLHCLNQKAEAVIDEAIKGFIVDTDGSKGIAGRVVTRAGANTARMFIAGMIGGFGSGIEESNTAASINPLGGSIQEPVDTKQSLKRGFGRGIGSSSTELSKVFLDLVKQSSPIIEVGPAKKITLALTEGVTLNIRDLRTDQNG